MPNLIERARSVSTAIRYPRWSAEQFRAFQNRRLKKLVRHAYDHVPLYRAKFEQHGVHPDDFGGLDDIERLPIVERVDFQERPPSELVAKGFHPDRLVIRRTGGSSGAPLEVRRTWFEERLLHFMRLREHRRNGLRLTDLRVGISSGNTPPSGHRFDNRHLARFGLLRLAHVSCMQPAREILDQLAELDPDVIGAYGGALAWIASAATPEDRRRIRPRYVFTGAETLTPDMRRHITDFFAVPLYDSYGAHEFNILAAECGKTGLYHISAGSLIVEVLNHGQPVAPGETGETVGTALHSFAMPFIRYRLGDLVTRGPERCPCGAPVATLEKIVGRTMDYFPLPDGSTVHPYQITLPLSQNAPWLRRFQVTQIDLHHIEVKLVPLRGQQPSSEDLRRIQLKMEEAVGLGISVAVRLASELPPANNGKFRVCRTLVNRRP